MKELTSKQLPLVQFQCREPILLDEGAMKSQEGWEVRIELWAPRIGDDLGLV